MFRREKEMQSLINASRKALADAEKTIKDDRDKILQRDKIIERQSKTIDQQREENLALYEENKDLRYENEESTEIFKRIISLAESNTYNNEKLILNKVKELAQTAIKY